jgi:hypothetical protein
MGDEEMEDEPPLQAESNVPQSERISTQSIERLIPPAGSRA